MWRVVQERAGFRGGARILELIMMWAIFEAENGSAPLSVEEFVAWWGDDSYSLATAYRRLVEFRECFEPEGLATPTDLFHRLGVAPSEFSVHMPHEGALA